MKNILNLLKNLTLTASIIFLLTACGSSSSNSVIVYNWGEYMDPEIIEMFEKETGIKVVYEEFENNEMMYPKVVAGATAYDLVCPSDYMISKMIKNNLLSPLDYSLLPNATAYIDKEYLLLSERFDKGTVYSVPYAWGTVGILYNKSMVKKPVDSWEILWDPEFKDNILMQDSVRDAFMIALIKNGFSMNSIYKEDLEIAKNDLIAQKPLVQAYVIDQVREKMIGNEAALGVIYSGEALYTKRNNPDLEYIIPKEGTNVWIDSWVIPKNAENKENAHKFLNFLCRPDIAYMNFDYITYATPNTGARDLIEDEELRNSPTLFPALSQYDNLDTFSYLGEETETLYNELWKEIRSN